VRSGGASLLVNPLPDFTLAVSPAAQTVTPGSAATYSIAISAIGDFNSSVSLVCAGLPVGASCSFSPNPAPPGNATLTLATSSTTPSGSAAFSVSGTAGTLAHSVAVRIAVGTPPVVPSGSVTNGASFTPGATPGSIVSIFGTHLTSLAAGIVIGADKLPLPTTLNGVSVTVNGMPAPLFAIANTGDYDQVNLQIPYEVTGLSTITMVVTNNGVAGAPVQVALQREQPGIFVADWNTGAGAILHGTDYGLVSADRPATRGETVIIYATGLGPVSPAPPTGYPASAAPLSLTTIPPVVSFGGIAASEVFFAGLAPGFVGLYQVNARIPLDAPSGALDLVIQTGGQSSNPVKLLLQ
jgi:uncharacterized protein (TIGR03437 family)